MLKSSKPKSEVAKGKLLSSIKPELQQHISKLFDLSKQPSKHITPSPTLYYARQAADPKSKVNKFINNENSQRSLSENRLIQKLKEQSMSQMPQESTIVGQQGSTEDAQEPKEEQEVAKSVNHSPSKGPKEVCTAEGHEKNEIKFICMSSDCTRRLQRGCAYCMLQYHAKHLEEMFEVDSKSLRSSFNKSASLYAQSQALLKNLESHPLEQFFASMKSAVLQKLSEMEDKIKQIYKQQISEALAVDLLNIKKYNQQFASYSSKKMEDLIKEAKHLDRLHVLLNGECFEKYQLSVEEVAKKLDQNQIQINENDIVSLTKTLEELTVQIISRAMEQSTTTEKSPDNLVTFQCDIQQQQQPQASSIQSENQSPRQILPLKRSSSQHMSANQFLASPRLLPGAPTIPLGSARLGKQNFVFLSK